MAKKIPPPIVMISSTIRDLPDHRQGVLDACLRQGMFPKMMEHLPANDDDAIANSLALVDEADIYVGIFAYRYGYIPKGRTKSVTQLEYEHAVKRGIPRKIFVMHKDHPVKPADVETGDGAEKLAKFKEKLKADNFVNEFASPDELVKHVVNALAAERKRRQEAEDDSDAVVVAGAMHPPTNDSDPPADDTPIAGPLQVYIDADAYSAEEKGELLSLVSELYRLQSNDRLVIDHKGTAEPVGVEVGSPNGGTS
ncbi:MAG: DUF4062 domain-containing protein [Thermoguttaceae bacterium]